MGLVAFLFYQESPSEILAKRMMTSEKSQGLFVRGGYVTPSWPYDSI